MGLAAACFYWMLGPAPHKLVSGMICAFVAFVWVLWTLRWTLLIPSLHRAETKVTPRLFSLLHFKRAFKGYTGALGIWIVLSFFLAALPYMGHATEEWVKQALVCGWLVLTGLLFEGLSRQYYHAVSLLDPFQVLLSIEKEVGRAKGQASDQSLDRWSEAVEQIAAQSLDKDASALAGASVQTLCNITEKYIQNNASRLLPTAPEESQYATRYVLHNILEKNTDLYTRARREGHHGVCEQILAGCGKLAIVAAEKNPALAAEPIEYIGVLGVENMQTDKNDLGLKTTRLLMQVFKRIAAQRHTEKVSIESPAFALIDALEKLAKESFRKNKETPIPLLAEPFREIETLFKEGVYSTYPESEAILQKTKHVLADFANLELILRTLPPLPSLEAAAAAAGSAELPNKELAAAFPPKPKDKKA